MGIVPAVRAARFEQLEPGDLFIAAEGQHFWAMKTQQVPNDGRCGMVVLGPQFPADSSESFLLSWQGITVLSLGKSFSILPSLSPESWLSTPTRIPVCLAVADEKSFICTNGSPYPNRFLPYFVDVDTGAIVEGRLPGIAVFTNAWEIVSQNGDDTARPILRFPL
ncbi:hypothetical protein [Bradyrhizobium sp. USDA 4451]